MTRRATATTASARGVMAAALAALAFAGAAAVAVRGVQFTGDAFKDFTDSSFDMVSMRPHNFGVVRQLDISSANQTCGAAVCPDVGTPNLCANGVCPISGWDIRAIYMQYNDLTDELHIGIDCFGICGDADGDGLEGATSPNLVLLGGVDVPDMAGSEGMAIALDFDLNVADSLPVAPNTVAHAPFDFIVGVPNGQPANARASPRPGTDDTAFLPCTVGANNVTATLLSASSCFGVYVYHNTTAVNLGQRFLAPAITDDGRVWPAVNQNPRPSATAPDVEWTVQRVTDLRRRKGVAFRSSNQEPWTVLMQAFAGSFQDDGIGEDYMPAPTDYVEVTFPCLALDECDVCFGDGSSCLDCTGVANGPAAYDVCDVCDGDGSSCADCTGAANGPAQYDACDVCLGDGTTCADCAGTPNGAAQYDECSVCEGDGSTCDDCLGVANGSAQYDDCGVCEGDNTSCADCAGAPNGGATYDVCGVCQGDGSSCADCKGEPLGSSLYDACGVCDGDGSTCKDCAGTVDGPLQYDVCDVCGGDGTTCLDCQGTPNGPCQYDACDVCCGDSTTCLDCADVPFGTNKYDACGVCAGDGSSCVCLSIHNCPTDEVDHALLEWTLVAAVDRIGHTVEVLEGIKEELCAYDVGRGNLAADIAGYLDQANDFRQVLDNFEYVSVFFKSELEEALAATAP